MVKKYLVTGGLGFLGASLVKRLVEGGDVVRVLDNSLRGSTEKLGETVSDVELIEGDIRDPETVYKSIEGVDCVCHLAFVNGTEFFYEKPAFVLDVGVKGMVNVIDGCMKTGVGDLVYASSSEVYQTPPSVPTDESAPLSVPDPLNPRYSYGGGKIIGEIMALNYGREFFDRVTIFRPHNVYGPAMGYEHVIPQFTANLHDLSQKQGDHVTLPIQGDGSQTRAFIFVDDFTDGLQLVVEKGENQNIYHIGSMNEVSIADLASKVGACMGLEVSLKPGPEAKGGTPRRCPDTTKLQALGFSTKTSLEDGLKETVAWYLDHPKTPGKSFLDKVSIYLP